MYLVFFLIFRNVWKLLLWQVKKILTEEMHQGTELLPILMGTIWNMERILNNAQIQLGVQSMYVYLHVNLLARFVFGSCFCTV